MTDKVSIMQALQRGRLIISPLVILPVPLLILILNIVTRCNVPDYVMVITFFVSLILIIILVLVYWKYAMIKWQIWAFMKVDNALELEKAADIANLTSNVVNLAHVADKYPEAFKQIQQRLKEPYKLLDDSDIPSETVIYFRKIYQQSISFFLLAVTLFGCYGMVHHFMAYMVVFTLLPIAVLFALWYNTSDRSPQVTISDEGIDADGIFTSWSDITNEEVIAMWGRSASYFLNYESPDGKKEVKINNLYIKPQKLNHLIFVYRARHQVKHYSK